MTPVTSFKQTASSSIGVWLSGILLCALFATPSSAGNRQDPVVGLPVDRSGRAIELRTKTEDENPIAYSFRIAGEEPKAEAQKGDGKDAESLPLPPATKQELSPAQQYCSSILDATSAAQIAEQTRGLQKAQKDIEARIALLSAKAELLKSWMKMRQDFSAHATDALVQIYTRMKPDAAAAQLAAMDEMTSAAIIAKLAPKVSSPLLAEMDVGKAARLSGIIAGAGEIETKPERKADAQ
jgi:flagellar motility protein MotE (MotC chaperone)